MLFALLKKLQNYAIFMLKLIKLCPIILTYAANVQVYDGSVQNNRGVFCRGRCTSSKCSMGSTHRPTYM